MKVQLKEPLKFLTVLGLNPTKKNKISKLRCLLSVGITTATGFLAFLEILFNYKGLETLSRASESMIVEYQIVHKIAVLLLHKNKILLLIKNTSKFWDFELLRGASRLQLERVHKILNHFFRIYKMLMVAMTLQFVSRKIINRNGLPLSIIYGETSGFSPMVDLGIFIFHSVGTLVVFHIVVGFDGLFFYFVGHVLTELRMVKRAFGTRRDFVSAIRHHQFVLEYIEGLNEVYSNVLLNQHVSCLFGICFGLFLLSKDGTPPDLAHVTKYCPYILSFVTQTFTFCFFGSLIVDWSVEISDAVFYGSWDHEQTYKDEKIMVMRRAQKPAKFAMGRYGDLSLESFTWVVKNAFSFYTFISSLNEKSHLL